MKKKYVKPVIAIENFILTEHIATCEGDTITFDTKLTCGNNINTDFNEALDLIERTTGLRPFNNDECSIQVAPGYEFQDPDGVKLCYHSSTGLSVFGS